MLGIMAKKQPKKYERGRDRGEVTYVGAEIENDLAQAMADYITMHGSTKKFLIESGLKMFLQSKGILPIRDADKK